MSQVSVSVCLKTTVFIIIFNPDQDNYQTLFGAVDNSFLVAYAIGMFFRYGSCRRDTSHQCLCMHAVVLSCTFSQQWHLWGAIAPALLPHFRDAP